MSLYVKWLHNISKNWAKVLYKIVAKSLRARENTSARDNTFAREKTIKEDVLAYAVSITYITATEKSGCTHVFKLYI